MEWYGQDIMERTVEQATLYKAPQEVTSGKQGTKLRERKKKRDTINHRRPSNEETSNERYQGFTMDRHWQMKIPQHLVMS